MSMMLWNFGMDNTGTIIKWTLFLLRVLINVAAQVTVKTQTIPVLLFKETNTWDKKFEFAVDMQ